MGQVYLFAFGSLRHAFLRPLGRRFSSATKLTYRIPANHPLQYKKPLVNNNKIDLTHSLLSLL